MPGTPKRYCKRGHDTHLTGRYPSNNCILCHKENMAKRDRRQRTERIENAPAEAVPGLRELRMSRGYTVEQLAWECHGLSVLQLQMIESGTRYATYPERVQIFQAFNILKRREHEAEEARAEKERRIQMAGLA